MEKNQKNVKALKSGGLRLFLMNKLKKYDTASVAESVQRTLHLSVTRSFDLRTMVVLSRPMKAKKYKWFKDSVNTWLRKLN